MDDYQPTENWSKLKNYYPYLQQSSKNDFKEWKKWPDNWRMEDLQHLYSALGNYNASRMELNYTMWKINHKSSDFKNTPPWEAE
jgi:hypothetical protein